MAPSPTAPARGWLWPLLLGLSALAPCQARLELHVPSGLGTLQAVEGAEVVLPAWYTLQGEEADAQRWEVPVVIWFLEQEGKDLSQVLAYINGVSSGWPRASLAHAMPSRNVSLRLRGVREQDSGSYRCSVNVQDSQGQGGSRGHSSKTLGLSVLVPPAPPACRVLGQPRVGANVSLSCGSPRSKPAARYQWERLPPSPQVFFPPVSDDVQGFLHLTNLSTSMSGVYVCKAQNLVGGAYCNVTLEGPQLPRLPARWSAPWWAWCCWPGWSSCTSAGTRRRRTWPTISRRTPLLPGRCPGPRAQTLSPRTGLSPPSPQRGPSGARTRLPGPARGAPRPASPARPCPRPGCPGQLGPARGRRRTAPVKSPPPP